MEIPLEQIMTKHGRCERCGVPASLLKLLTLHGAFMKVSYLCGGCFRYEKGLQNRLNGEIRK